ncbi:tyrosine-type recombinase/integrase [Cryptosporangium phraense]|uniref:Tyrosine-type recombinase/integrase n=1 Tax=Cryptosporangium phraense TaxID=2593070 RepID=A0A545AW86_9ACTN|nr:tyrosine-type recombinase/integrase [Cryptosporangium phraense]TQS45587.1 tyrosine-type recombinase/integrase [Cryptosporangium phraense]
MSVEKRPNGRWRARYRDATGEEHAKHFDRKAEAERWLSSMRAAPSRGDWIDPALSEITVGECSAGWFAAQVQLEPSTRERYASVLRNQIHPHWERVPLSGVNHADVAAWGVRLSNDGLGARSVHKAHRVLSQILDLAVRYRRLSTNPAKGVRLPRADRPSKRFLTVVQVRDLADAAGPDKTLVHVLAYCGLRFGELAALRVQDVDLARRRIHVERSVVDINGHMVSGSPKSSSTRACSATTLTPSRTASTTSLVRTRCGPPTYVNCKNRRALGQIRTAGTRFRRSLSAVPCCCAYAC